MLLESHISLCWLQKRISGDYLTKTFFHQENAPEHKGAFAMAKLWSLYLTFPAILLFYSFGTLRFLSIPKPKKIDCGKCFAFNDEVKRAIEKYFHKLPDSLFREGILMLKRHGAGSSVLKKGHGRIGRKIEYF